MISSFEAVTDRQGRIEHFAHPEFPGQRIAPAMAGEMAEPEELVRLGGTEFAITSSGSLVHPEVEIPNGVSLGQGVRLDKGTTFPAEPIGDEMLIQVGDKTRVVGSELGDLVKIGMHSVVKAQSIGNGSVIGNHVRIGGGVVVQGGVEIADSVKVYENARICSRAVLEYVSRVGPGVIIPPDARVLQRRRVGQVGVARHRLHSYGGPYIRPGAEVSTDRI